MPMTDTALSQHLLFDLSGQQVAVTKLEVDESGRLKTEWAILGKRLYSDDDTDIMLNQAFKFLFDQMATTPDGEEPELETVDETPPEPDLKQPIWLTLLHRIKELW